MTDFPKFDGLAVSSKFAICGLPIRLDSYRTCTFGCEYCFSNGRKIMEFNKEQPAICNVESVRNRLERVQNGLFDEDNFLDVLISNGYTWHCGGMSDPFQPLEGKLGITHELIDLTKEHGISILFSTKSDTVYNANIHPAFHTFQLSVSNVDNRKDIEAHVPDIEKRLAFFRQLKADGFKVGIRIQPFIPGVTSLDVVKMFEGADHFTIEGIKIVPQNEEQKEVIMQILKDAPFRPETAFTQMGLLNIKPEVRYELYKPFVDYFEQHGISYSIADNDMRWMGNNRCCCGDALVAKATNFNVTEMIRKYGRQYRREQLMAEVEASGCGKCKCADLFTSNRTQGCKTVEQVMRKRFTQESSPFSPRFQFVKLPGLFD